MTGAGLSDEEDDDLEHSDLSDDESERMLSDSRKLKVTLFWNLFVQYEQFFILSRWFDISSLFLYYTWNR